MGEKKNERLNKTEKEKKKKKQVQQLDEDEEEYEEETASKEALIAKSDYSVQNYREVSVFQTCERKGAIQPKSRSEKPKEE